MTVEELKKLRTLQFEIKSKYEILEEAKASTTRITQLISDMPKAKGVGEGFSPAVIKVMTMTENMKKIVSEMTELFSELYQKAVNEISKIENLQERTLLEYRYLSYKSWYEIASFMKLSYRRVLQLHKKAISHFA